MGFSYEIVSASAVPTQICTNKTKQSSCVGSPLGMVEQRIFTELETQSMDLAEVEAMSRRLADSGSCGTDRRLVNIKATIKQTKPVLDTREFTLSAKTLEVARATSTTTTTTTITV